MTDFLEQWANQSDENGKLAAQELLITEVTEAIWEAVEEAGVTKTELASRMGTTKGYISQVLSGSRNMTLRTLSDICHALHRRPAFALPSKIENVGWRTVPSENVLLGHRKVLYARTGNLISPVDHWQAAA